MKTPEQYLSNLETAIEPLLRKIINHPVFSRIRSTENLIVFMEHHVAAVWDFMSLLKYLQRELTCTTIPWQPTAEPITRRLINQIVLAEESDISMSGEPISHYELYLSAMKTVGSKLGGLSEIPQAAKQFNLDTFKLIETNTTASIAAVFAYGREDLIPEMFTSLISQLQLDAPERLSEFQYYLNRHIELDEDEHAPLAKRMVIQLCGTDKEKWLAATEAVKNALKSRLALWDGVLNAL